MSFVRRLASCSFRSIPARTSSRSFRTCAVYNAASNFAMPALSPTMTEGGISGWKIKEGESFNAGDIILEIETDKAQMDVEAQDDGILVKIYKDAGTKEIPVGATIAVIAEPGDDIASLEIPELATKSSAPAAEPEPAEQAPVPSPQTTEPAPAPAREKKVTSTGGSKADPAQVFFPSVLGLLHANHISEAEAIQKISASGPKGRITKGDVLAYLGVVSGSRIKELTNLIHSREHLDLSNIKIAEPKPKKEEKPKEEKPVVPVAQKPKVVINFDELLTFNPPRRK
ncbi:single hybrid motif-containing protein [Lipomyces chichibuensis]|uniref:single hybrid motif-containing protein n=1 Tax=Lipomyces chichibuensis TaxID=1546026 RepID=UPI003343E109